MAFEYFRAAQDHLRRPFDRAGHLRRTARVLKLSKPALGRLEWIIWYEANGRNALKTSRRFGLAPKTFWKWRKRFNEANLGSLEELSRAPKKRKERAITPLQAQRVVDLKKARIRYGKAKIAALYLAIYHENISQWKVQKVIEARKLHYHPARQSRINRKRRNSVRKKRITEIKMKRRTGFLLCLDTVVIYWNGLKRYVFTAVDRHAKVAFARMYPSKSSRNAADFLLRLNFLLDGKIENVGHDNGSEFQGEFAVLCRKMGVAQYHSRTRTPKDNAVNERFNRTLQDEFISMGNLTFDTTLFNRRLTEWLIEYNFRRPHQTLGYMPPINFVYKHERLLPMSPSSTGPCQYQLRC